MKIIEHVYRPALLFTRALAVDHAATVGLATTT
jgi:hypothetical protein